MVLFACKQSSDAGGPTLICRISIIIKSLVVALMHHWVDGPLLLLPFQQHLCRWARLELSAMLWKQMRPYTEIGRSGERWGGVRAVKYTCQLRIGACAQSLKLLTAYSQSIKDFYFWALANSNRDFSHLLAVYTAAETRICSPKTNRWEENGNADPEFTAKHGSSKQQWARQPGTITLSAANSALVSGVNLASGASQYAPWVPDCLCGSVQRCGRQSSPLSPQYRPRLAVPATSKPEALHRAEQTRGSGPTNCGLFDKMWLLCKQNQHETKYPSCRTDLYVFLAFNFCH